MHGSIYRFTIYLPVKFTFRRGRYVLPVKYRVTAYNSESVVHCGQTALKGQWRSEGGLRPAGARVVYRSEAGTPVALDDTCPHRLAPLLTGKLEGDAIECGYHGMTFGADGRWTRIPGQSLIRRMRACLLSVAREDGAGLDLARRS